MPQPPPSGRRDDGIQPLNKAEFEALSRFRYGLRRFLRFSEDAARSSGLTPQQYQLLLTIKGFPGREWATVGEAAERLQIRHNSAVGLVDRCERLGFVRRESIPDDRRVIAIHLTEKGEQILDRLASLHRRELDRLRDLLAFPEARSRA